MTLLYGHCKHQRKNDYDKIQHGEMTLDDLHNTEESEWILNEYSKIHKKINNTSVYSRENHTKEELYIIDCFVLYSRLMETCTQIDKIPVYLSRFDKKYFSNNEIGQTDFIQYHLEVYIGKLFAIAEIMLSLTNEIYKFELKPKQRNFQNIMKLLDDSKVSKKILVSLFDNLKNWRLIRNDTVHRNIFNKDEKFERLSMQESLWMHSERIEYDLEIDWVFVKPRHFVDYFLKQERKTKVQFIQKNNLGLFKYIDYYLKSIINELRDK